MEPPKSPSNAPTARYNTLSAPRRKPPKTHVSGPVNRLGSAEPALRAHSLFRNVASSKNGNKPRPAGLRAAGAPSMAQTSPKVYKIPNTPKSNHIRTTLASVESKTNALGLNTQALSLSLMNGGLASPAPQLNEPAIIPILLPEANDSDSDSDSDFDFDLEGISHQSSKGDGGGSSNANITPRAYLNDIKDPIKRAIIIKEGQAKSYPMVDLTDLERQVMHSSELIKNILSGGVEFYYINQLREYTNQNISALRASSNHLAHFANPNYDFGYLGPRGKTTIVSTILQAFAKEINEFRSQNHWARKFDILSFIEIVIAPEIAVDIIMKDVRNGLVGQDKGVARELMKQSSQYGRARDQIWAEENKPDHRGEWVELADKSYGVDTIVDPEF